MPSSLVIAGPVRVPRLSSLSLADLAVIEALPPDVRGVVERYAAEGGAAGEGPRSQLQELRDAIDRIKELCGDIETAAEVALDWVDDLEGGHG